MSGNSRGQSKQQQKSGGCTLCIRIALVLAIIIIPWLVRVSYLQFQTDTHPASSEFSPPTDTVQNKPEHIEQVSFYVLII